MKDRAFAQRNMHEGNVYAKQKAIMEGQYLKKGPHKEEIHVRPLQEKTLHCRFNKGEQYAKDAS